MAVHGHVDLSRRRRAGRLGVDIGLGVLAAAGAICGLCLLGGLLLQLSVVLFATGSMAPSIPTGSVAVVQRIPASAALVGDVVTVDRAGLPPVTHRVVATSGSGPTRTLRLKGDANRSPDALPYTVTSVRIVRLSVPGLAPVIVWFRSPLVLGGLTLVAASIVVWAFWPRGRRATTTAAVLVAVACAGAALGPAAPARADPVGPSRYLRLTSTPSPEMSDLAPGASADWRIDVAAVDPPGPGTVHVGLGLDAASGAVAALRVSMTACLEPSAGSGCAASTGSWLAPTGVVAATVPATAYGAREHGSFPATSRARIVVRVARDAAPPGPVRVLLRLQTWAFGESAATGSGELPRTGPVSIEVMIGLALGAVGTGAVMRALDRRRR